MIRAAIQLCAIVLLCASTVFAQESLVKPLFQVNLDDLQDQEGLIITVDFPPGATGTQHRHNAHTFVYVLEGSVVMQVEGGGRTVLRAGQTFYETPDDIHIVSMNASMTEPAKILVFFVKQQGTPVTVPVP